LSIPCPHAPKLWETPAGLVEGAKVFESLHGTKKGGIDLKKKKGRGEEKREKKKEAMRRFPS